MIDDWICVKEMSHGCISSKILEIVNKSCLFYMNTFIMAIKFMFKLLPSIKKLNAFEQNTRNYWETPPSVKWGYVL